MVQTFDPEQTLTGRHTPITRSEIEGFEIHEKDELKVKDTLIV